jgi:hypothetical protein
MPKSVLLDAGPLVAYLREAETYHRWAVEQFKRFAQFSTCDAVLAEACASARSFPSSRPRQS